MTMFLGKKGKRRRFAQANRLLFLHTKIRLSFRMNPPPGGRMRNLLRFMTAFFLKKVIILTEAKQNK
jgi:hypothetical protein